MADELLLDAMAAHKLPSLSVAVSSQGEIVYAAALGSADLKTQSHASLETVYAQGSVTKVLTAVAALMLVQEGSMSLDQPVQTTCPSFPVQRGPITIRQLLAHTAGIRHYDYRRFQEDFLNAATYDSVSASLAKFRDDPLVAAPGEKYHYSSWGYVVVACAIEGASQQSFDVFLEQRLFEPVEMLNSSIDRPDQGAANRAIGYTIEEDGSYAPSGVQNPSDRYGASGLLSTPTDLVRFANALLSGRYLNDELVDAMWSAQRLNSGERIDHGLGWDLDPVTGTVTKGGTAFDASSYLLISRNTRTIVAISTNLVLWVDGRAELARNLADVFGSGSYSP